MKVVLFCGGLGLRIRDADGIPKPMVRIGYRPILWHVMKYYAHFGHKDFILCLGHGADAIKEYFLNYNECVSNDFVLSRGGKKLELFNSDIDDWRITFADTGINSNIGQRLKAVQKYLEGEEEFLANYSDGLTDLPLPQQLDHFHEHGKIASFLCVRPNLSYHIVSLQQGSASLVSGIHAINNGSGPHQWRLLHLQEGDLRLYRAQGGTGGRALPTAARAEAADRISVRRLLGEHGHLQGQAAPGGPARRRRCSLGGVEDRAEQILARRRTE